LGTPVRPIRRATVRRGARSRGRRVRYQQPGTYTVTVKVLDDDGDVGTATFTVEVEQPGLNSSLVDLAFASYAQSVNGGPKR
jgi:hypothetical protein